MQKFVKNYAVLAMNKQYNTLLKGWIPWRLIREEEKMYCEWLFTGYKLFTEPFFDDTIRVCRTMNENRQKFKAVSDLEFISNCCSQDYAAQTTAVIFHVSRCGSTLLSQMLSCNNRHAVLSEVPFIDQLLRLHYTHEHYKAEQIEQYVKASVGLYHYQPQQTHLFVKTDSWHLHFYEQYRKLYPDALFVLLYREPAAVIQSQQKQRGLHAVPGLVEPQLFGLNVTEREYSNFDLYMADVLQTYYQKMIAIASGDVNVLLVNYSQGMQYIIAEMYRLLKLDLDTETEHLFEERNRFHAKRPDQIFTDEKLTAELPPFLTRCYQLYDRLEELRLAKA